MASCKEISKLVTDMNHTVGSCRPSRNGQGICDSTFQPTPMSTTQLPETPANTKSVPHIPIKTPQARGTPSPGNNSTVQDVANTNTPTSMLVATQDRQHQVEVLTPSTRQYDRFVDPQGRPLQPGTVIFCDDFPFIVSANGRIYNYTGGNTKQIYIAESKAKKWNNMAQVLQDVAEMAISFERSRGYSLPSFEINQTTDYSSQCHSNSQCYKTNKLYTKEAQHFHTKPEKIKCLEYQGDHLKKDLPMVQASQGKSKHFRFQDNKERQHMILKSFQKKFLNKKESVNELAETSEDEKITEEHWNQFFREFEKLICKEGEDVSN